MRNRKTVPSLMTGLILSLIMACGNTTAEKEHTGSESKPNEAFSSKTQLATFAGGCFWCVEAPFEEVDGVISVVSGYSGGKEKDPTYAEVSSGKTSHRESIQITFDPEVVSYSELVDIFWQTFDPTDVGGSFFDRGSQYESAIFYHNDSQRKVAEESKKRLDQSGKFDKPIATPVIRYSNFYPAEQYHQDYYDKNPDDYNAYKIGSGRQECILTNWPVISEGTYPAPSKADLKKTLSPLQYQVTQENATEIAFKNEYNDNHEAGIYVCIVSGAPLFSSKDKYESGSGWPSFTKPIDARALEKPTDKSDGMTRVEIRSKYGKSHVGHSFYDGPEPTHLRYCMNSAAMKFVPKTEMEAAGYGEYLWLVD